MAATTQYERNKVSPSQNTPALQATLKLTCIYWCLKSIAATAVAWEIWEVFVTPPLVYLQNNTCEKQAQKFDIVDGWLYPDLVLLIIGWAMK